MIGQQSDQGLIGLTVDRAGRDRRHPVSIGLQSQLVLPGVWFDFDLELLRVMFGAGIISSTRLTRHFSVFGTKLERRNVKSVSSILLL
jgi:hypothetical protein